MSTTGEAAAASAKAVIELDPNFGYVIVVVILSVIFNGYCGFAVGRGRKKYGVEYPLLYGPDPDKHRHFNCIQRAHQNFLETYPQMLALLFSGSLFNALGAAIAGVVYLAGRFVYFQGYASGDPKKRLPGSFWYFAALYLMFLNGKGAFDLITA